MIAYILDQSLRETLNVQSRNHWDVYLQEICNQLGVTAKALSLTDIENPRNLERIRTLIIGAQSGAKLTPCAHTTLTQWVHGGGLLIGFDVAGLDDLFGIEPAGVIAQPDDDYTIAAYFQFWPHPLTREIHPFLDLEQKLFTLSETRRVKLHSGVELGRLFDEADNDLNHPAITLRDFGRGKTVWFAFDVAKTIWLLHQGRPLPHVPEGQFAMRTSQMQTLGPNSTKVAYADEIVHLLQNVIALTGQPFIYPIPPKAAGDTAIPDALLYYSGDEYTGPVEWSLQASDFMKSRNLPYHINIAAHLHPMTRAQFDHIRSNGHEVSNYMWIKTADRKGSVIRPEVFKQQCDALHSRFGARTGSVLVGSCQWQGWAETARWLAEAGATADNTFIGNKGPRNNARRDANHQYGNPWYNGSFYGFGFGTGYPFYFYEAHDHGNRRIPLIEQPIICYELGHRASNIIDEKTELRELETSTPEDLHEPIDRAVRYHLVMNVFYHPYYIVNYPHCRAAIDEILRYIDYKGANVLHMGNNAVADWWNARSASRLDDLSMDQDTLTFTSDCRWPAGMIVRLRWSAKPSLAAIADGRPLTTTIKRESGEDWLYLAVPHGRCRIELHPAPM